MLTLYGDPMSRAHRVMWMLRELGVDFEHVLTDFLKGGTKAPQFLDINPNGKVPVLVHDGVVVFESFAINLYLARAFGGSLAAQSLAEEAGLLQWCFWAVNELEKTILVAAKNLSLFPPDARRPDEADMAMRKLDRPLKVMEAHLTEHGYLVGGRFTVADLSTAAMMTLVPIAGLDISPYPHVGRWLETCLARPAADDYLTIRFTIPRPPTDLAWLQSLM